MHLQGRCAGCPCMAAEPWSLVQRPVMHAQHMSKDLHNPDSEFFLFRVIKGFRVFRVKP